MEKYRIVKWNTNNDGVLSEESIRLRFGAPMRARVSSYRHEPWEEVVGKSKAAHCHVIEGGCIFRDNNHCTLHAGDVLVFAGGDYEFVAGELGVVLVWAWGFPQDFVPDC